MGEKENAFDHLRNHQRQLDRDGVEVGVSRQALDEILEEHKRLSAYVTQTRDFDDYDLSEVANLVFAAVFKPQPCMSGRPIDKATSHQRRQCEDAARAALDYAKIWVNP